MNPILFACSEPNTVGVDGEMTVLLHHTLNSSSSHNGSPMEPKNLATCWKRMQRNAWLLQHSWLSPLLQSAPVRSCSEVLVVFQFPRASYGGRHMVTLLPGDGVGPELMQHVKEVFRCSGTNTLV